MEKINNIPQRRSIFQKKNKKTDRTENLNEVSLKRNDLEKQKKLKEKIGKDVKLSIPRSVKDFARIKKAVDQVPEKDNSEKIKKLKEQIQNGTYDIKYEKLADAILEQELF